jgi:hypothetical protein
MDKRKRAMKKYLIIILILALSCSKYQVEIEPTSLANAIKMECIANSAAIEEYFVDSLSIGDKTFNKIEFTKFMTNNDSAFVEINFYSKENNKWVLKSMYRQEADPIFRSFPVVSDFNGDGLNDFIYTTSFGARLSNAINDLFIYNKELNSLIYLQNSADYYNLYYNEKLNSVNSLVFHAGCNTSFLKIVNDSLKIFAEIEIWGDSVAVTELNDKGEWEIIYKDTISDCTNPHFKNYKPLELMPNKKQD